MYLGKTLFAQAMDFLPWKTFHRIVNRYGGDHRTRMASANVAMPAGLLVNELMTNAFKYAFTGRKTGTIMIRCLNENKTDYRIEVADDGVGLPDGNCWPMPGKLSALILQTLRENTEDADVIVESAPGKGTRVTISGVRHGQLRHPAEVN